MPCSKKQTFRILIDVAVLLVIGIILFLVNSHVKPSERGFYCIDNDIFYPLLPEIKCSLYYYPAIKFNLILITANLICIIEWTGLSYSSRATPILISLFNGIITFLFGLVTTLLLTEIGKRWIGRLRPNFLQVCNPDLQNLNCTSLYDHIQVLKYIETSGSFCRSNPNVVEEARLSFPSGHSSTSFYTMVFLIFYIEARVSSLKLRYFKVFIQLTAFTIAFWTSISPIKYHHNRGIKYFKIKSIAKNLILIIAL